MQYISINGYKMTNYTNSKKEISINLLEYLECPISKQIISKPVIFNGNIYEHSNIMKWLRITNSDPMTNSMVNPGKIYLQPFYQLFVLLLSLEKCGDNLYLHKFDCTYDFVLFIAKSLYENKIYNQYTDTRYVENYKCKYLYIYDETFTLNLYETLPTLEITDDTEHNKILNDSYINNIHRPVNNKNICKCVICRENKLSDNFVDINDLLFYDENNKEMENYKINNNIIHKTFFDSIKPYLFEEKQENKIKRRSIIYGGGNIFKSNKKDITISFYCDVNSCEENIFLDAKNIQEKINNDTGLQNVIKLCNYEINEKMFSFGNTGYSSKINILKTNFEFPMFQPMNNYGVDVSFMHIKNLTFNNIDSKSCVAINTTFYNCNFINSRFSIGKFIGCKFINCKFENITRTGYSHKNIYEYCYGSLN